MKLVGAMTLEQKIAQLHGAMQTIDIYALTAEAAESGADMDRLAAPAGRVGAGAVGARPAPRPGAVGRGPGRGGGGPPFSRTPTGGGGGGGGPGPPPPPATSLPMTIGLAAGFDPDLAHAYGDLI